MTVLELLNVLSESESVKIYNEGVVWHTDVIPVYEAKETTTFHHLKVRNIWVSINGYIVIECGEDEEE